MRSSHLECVLFWSQSVRVFTGCCLHSCFEVWDFSDEIGIPTILGVPVLRMRLSRLLGSSYLVNPGRRIFRGEGLWGVELEGSGSRSAGVA